MAFSLFPKNERFFDLFSLSASNIRVAAEQLLNMVQDFSQVEEKANRLKEVESAGDSITHCSKITKLRPVDGFAAETAGGVIIIALTEWLKMPISTTHAIAGSIMGVGATRRLSAVRWGVSARIVWAWIITIPASAAIAIATFWLTQGVIRVCAGINGGG